MPRIEIPVTQLTRAGVEDDTAVVSDASDGHYFTGNDGEIWLEIENVSATPRTVEILPSPSYTADGLTVNPQEVLVPANTRVKSGPFKVSTFKQNSSNDVYIDVPVDTDLELYAFRLGS